MADLSDFKRGQIVGARMAGTSITKTAELLGVSRGTVSKVMTAFEREGKTSSAKHRSGRKLKLSERDRRTLNQIVRKDRKTTASKITAELNEHLQNPVSQKLFVGSCTNLDSTEELQLENLCSQRQMFHSV
ncbi:uncharacterized protein LOC143029942 [Oratosquilla oratoria]|uniref:uncharacterized protein LOC143029942 n=1 Tax=Oratosquilla oratoria TaxID=337810 RepID=UPI003F777D35